MHQPSAVPAPVGCSPTGTAGFPLVAAAGVTLMVAALGLDGVAHAAVLPALEPVAHLAGVLGMATTWLAVVVDGATGRARR